MKRLVALLLGAFSSVASSEAANIVFVSFHSADGTPTTAAAAAGFVRAPDVGYTDLLTAAGHTVTRVVSTDIPNAAVLNAADLVIISRSVASSNYELDAETAAWNGITAPTILLNGYVLRDIRLGYTTGGTIPDTTGGISLKAQVPGHPIFAGVSLDASGRMANAYANPVTVGATLQRGISVNTSPVTKGGVILATVATATDAALGGMIIGEWVAGDSMATSPSDTLGGHRLVLLTGSREANGASSEIAGVKDLTSDGERIFLNAVDYMTSGRIAIRTVTTVDNETPAAGQLSLKQALTDAQDGDTIRFKIPGAGPHVITTPMGGYPLITANSLNIDGYTQPGASANTNPILAANNAQLDIVLDSTGDDSAENPVTPGAPLRRSTRLDFPNDPGNTGYGDSENGVLAVYQADNVTIRGLCFLGRRNVGDTSDPSIYAVALVRQALNARVQGCRFGLAPGAAYNIAAVKPVSAAVAAFRWRIGGDVYSDNAIVGTDGDGANDRAEFNVILGGRDPLACELTGLRISGNFVNVFPDGITFLDPDASYALWGEAYTAGGGDPTDVTIENFENGRVAHNTVIGTDGNGISDADERNVFGTVVYDHAGEFYSPSTNVVVAGNYFGVGVDGISVAPVSTNMAPDFMSLSGNPASIRIGSNGDGISDDLEGNVIYNLAGENYCPAGSSVPITSRGNVLKNNHFKGVPFADGQNSRTLATYYASYVADPSVNLPPVAEKIENNVLSGSFALPSTATPNAIIDVYMLDQAGLESTAYWPAPILHPARLVATLRDNDAADLNAAPGQFALNVASLGLTASTHLAFAVTYSETASAEAGHAVTSPMSNPVAQRPTLRFSMLPADVMEFWWFGPQGKSMIEINDDLNTPDNWFAPFGESYAGGRIWIQLPFDLTAPMKFFRVRAE